MNTLHRRDFLTQSALALTAAAVSPLPASRAVAASEKVRVGIIGCGGIGRVDLATFFLNPEVDCPVICDIDDVQLAETVKLVEG